MTYQRKAPRPDLGRRVDARDAAARSRTHQDRASLLSALPIRSRACIACSRRLSGVSCSSGHSFQFVCITPRFSGGAMPSAATGCWAVPLGQSLSGSCGLNRSPLASGTRLRISFSLLKRGHQTLPVGAPGQEFSSIDSAVAASVAVYRSTRDRPYAMTPPTAWTT